MTALTFLVSGLGGALVVAGLIGAAVGVRRVPQRPPGPPRTSMPPFARPARLAAVSRRTRLLLLTGVGVGVAVAALTGWLLAAVLVPAIVVGLPVLLSAPPAASKIERLEAMEEWTRSLSGVLTAGVGLEQALMATLRSTPDAIRPEVTQLIARLRARWGTEDALRGFADGLDDATGDLVAANLILGARRRGAGLASVLESLAESVAADVRARRQVEADRAKPRATARWVTLITVAVLAVLAVTGEYVQPYTSPVGQVILALLLGLYVATLVWMRTMATGQALPRFIGAAARAGNEAPVAGRSGRSGRQPVTSGQPATFGQPATSGQPGQPRQPRQTPTPRPVHRAPDVWDAPDASPAPHPGWGSR